MKKILLFCLLATGALRGDDFRYSEYWPIVEEIVDHMTLEQKIGHITLVPLKALKTSEGIFDPSIIKKYHLGAVLTGGSEAPDQEGNIRNSLFDPAIFDTATLENYQKLSQKLQDLQVEVSWDEEGMTKSFQIPPLLGTDSVHGNQHVLGSILFPHNIGLACAHDPELMLQVGYWTAHDTLESGFNWIFAPTTNRALNYQWGRTYETLGIDGDEIEKNSAAFVRGVQQFDPKTKRLTGALATTKHFLGLGTTLEGADEGNVSIKNKYKDFVDFHFVEYRGAIKAHTGSIMSAYNAVENIPMCLHQHLLWDVLKQGKYTHMPYEGFVVSDYDAIEKAAKQGPPTTTHYMQEKAAITHALLAGNDMLMFDPGKDRGIEKFQNQVKKLVKKGFIPMHRLDDAVKRILAVKYAMGLLQSPRAPIADVVGVKPEAEIALVAALKSFVLLKNEKDLLPVDPTKLKYIVLLGQRTVPVKSGKKSSPEPTLFLDFDNIGAQNGGWTVRWQGVEGNRYWQGEHKEKAHASSLLDGLTQLLQDYPDVTLLYPKYSSYTDQSTIAKESSEFLDLLKSEDDISSDNTLIIVTLAESPYAEYMGDVNISYCKEGLDESDSGCLYNHHLNPYMPDQQPTSLRITWDAFTEAALLQLAPEIPIATILFSGRPMILTEHTHVVGVDESSEIRAPLPTSTAFIAAWLPGTSGGQALAHALFGKYHFRAASKKANTLAVDWIRDMNDVSLTNPLYSVGYGLATSSHSQKVKTIKR